MDPKQAKQFGLYLREARAARNLSAVKLAKLTGISDGTIIRIENGFIKTPDPDKLVTIAEALGLDVSEVLTRAHYPGAKALPAFKPYLRSKYGELPEDAVERIDKYVTRIAKEHGVVLEGPAPGEDETP